MINHKLPYRELNGIMQTRCPFIDGVMVNSYTCKQCQYHQADNERKEFIICSNKGKIKEPEIIKDLKN